MEQKKGESVATTAWGEKLDKPVTYQYSWTAFENMSELRAANAYPSDDDVVKFVNAARQTSERQKAWAATMDALGKVKPTAENNEQVRLRDMYKVLMTSKRYSESQARELAASTLGIEWQD